MFLPLGLIRFWWWTLPFKWSNLLLVICHWSTTYPTHQLHSMINQGSKILAFFAEDYFECHRSKKKDLVITSSLTLLGNWQIQKGHDTLSNDWKTWLSCSNGGLFVHLHHCQQHKGLGRLSLQVCSLFQSSYCVPGCPPPANPGELMCDSSTAIAPSSCPELPCMLSARRNTTD